ncbi:unnamed protein product, partial [Mycena citricolor]
MQDPHGHAYPCQVIRQVAYRAQEASKQVPVRGCLPIHHSVYFLGIHA